MTEYSGTFLGLKTCWRECGSGIPVVILHGWGASSEKWSVFAQHLAGEGFHVVVPDLPGFGNTQQPISAWEVSDYVRWVRVFI